MSTVEELVIDHHYEKSEKSIPSLHVSVKKVYIRGSVSLKDTNAKGIDGAHGRG